MSDDFDFDFCFGIGADAGVCWLLLAAAAAAGVGAAPVAKERFIVHCCAAQKNGFDLNSFN